MAGKTLIEQFFVALDIDLKPETKRKINDFQKGLKGISLGITAIGGAVVGAGTALFTYTNSLTKSADENVKFADSLDISYERMQELQYAMEKSGGSAGELKGSLMALSRAQYALNNGFAGDSQAIAAAELGINDYGKSVTKTLIDISRTAKDMKSSDLQGWLSSLGISASPAMLNFLKQGPEAIKALGLEAREQGLISREAADNAQKFRDALTELGQTLNTIRDVILKKVAPVFTDLIKDFKEFIIQNKKLIKLKLGKFFESLGKAVKKLFENIRPILPYILEILQIVADLTNKLLENKIAFIALTGIIGASFVGKIVKLIMAMKGLGVAVKLLSSEMLLAAANPFFWIPMAIAGLILLATHIEEVTEWFTKMYLESKTFKSIADFILDYIYAPIQKVGDAIGWLYDLIGSIPDYIKPVIDWVKEMVNEITSAVDKVKNIVKNPMNTVKSIASDTLEGFTDFIGSAASYLAPASGGMYAGYRMMPASAIHNNRSSSKNTTVIYNNTFHTNIPMKTDIDRNEIQGIFEKSMDEVITRGAKNNTIEYKA